MRYGAHNVDADNHSSNEDDDGGGKEINLVVLWIYKMRSTTGAKCKALKVPWKDFCCHHQPQLAPV